MDLSRRGPLNGKAGLFRNTFLLNVVLKDMFLRNIILKDSSLRDVVFNDQLGTIRFQQCITAEELQEIGAEVVVVVFGEAQAELGYPVTVDQRKIQWVERLRVPVRHFGVGVQHGLILAGSKGSIEITQFQSRQVLISAPTDIHKQLAMSAKGIGAGDTCILELEGDGDNFGIHRYGDRIKGQNGTILPVGSIIPQAERGGGVVLTAAHTTKL